MELYHVFGGKYHRDIILLVINVHLVKGYFFPRENHARIAEEKA
jgi:hypothetical protein